MRDAFAVDGGGGGGLVGRVNGAVARIREPGTRESREGAEEITILKLNKQKFAPLACD